MARVTVEDCVIKIPNRFELVMLAAQRARNISAGAQLTLDRDNDKNPVVSLREIADQTVDISELEEGLIKGLQRHAETDEPDEDDMDLQAIQQEVGTVPGVNGGIAAEVLTIDDSADTGPKLYDDIDPDALEEAANADS